ncbi:MAG: riboflavin synthase [Abditibacteriaceae bacterium]
MFTGLVEEMGVISASEAESDSRLLTIDVSEDFAASLSEGDSVAICGTCLTVTSHSKSTFSALAVEETLRRTTLGKKIVGDSVNLERAMLVTARFGGHVVQGHVDGVGHIESVRPEGEGWWVTIEPPFALMKYVVEKGSITIDGISLTVANVAYRRFAVVVIPHTREVTTAGSWEKGVQLNLEVDLIAKYVERLLQWTKSEE